MKQIRRMLAPLQIYKLNHLGLLLAGVVLAVAGGMSPWLSFPLIPPISALALPFGPVSGIPTESRVFSQGAALLMLTAAGVICVLLGWRGWAASCFVAAIGLVVFAVAYIAFIEPTFYSLYVQDSIQRSSMQRFFNAYFWANKDVEPSLAYIPSFTYLSDRLALVWHMLAWGWVISVMGLSMIVGVLYRTAAEARYKLTLAVSLASTIVFIVIAMGGSALFAETLHRRGDAQLSGGEYAKAIDSFGRALQIDAALAHSEPFLVKVSKTYYQLNGGLDPYAQLHLAMLEIPVFKYDQAEFRLSQVSLARLQDSPFRAAMTHLAALKRSDALFSKALVQYKQGHLAEASAAFEQAIKLTPDNIPLQFFGARVYIDTRAYQRAASMILSIVPRVGSKSIRADLYSTLGDAYLLAGDEKRARAAYFTAYSLDSKGNYRAVKALSGT